MIFEIFNNFIENFLISYFIVRYIDFKNNSYKFLLFTITINTILSTVLTYYDVIGIGQTLLIQLIIALFLYKYHLSFSLCDIVVSLFCNILLFISVFLSITLFSFIYDINPGQVFLYDNIYIFHVIFSKFIFIIFLLLSNYIKPLVFMDAHIQEIGYLMIFEFLIITVMTYYFTSNIINENFKHISYVVIICFILLFISFCYIFNRIIILNLQVLQDKSKEEQLIQQKENLKNINSIKNYIDNTEHRINYILQSIEYDLIKEDYDQALNKIQLSKALINKIPTVINTKNELFDFMINLEIKTFYQSQKEVKVCVFISENDVYNQLELINRIIDVLKILYDYSDKIEMMLTENNNHLIVKYIIEKVHILNQQSINGLFSDNIDINDNEDTIIISYVENLKKILK